MGGGSYDRDVGHSSSSGGFSTGSTSSSSAKRAMGRSSQHKDTIAYGRRIKSESESPIVINLDVTGSNIEFARIVYDKAPMFYGQIEQQGYLKDFDMCFSATGDAHCDNYPLQVCEFKKGIDLEDEIKKLCLESGGGSDITETYELSAHYFANKCDMPNAKNPFCFFIADEAPYETLDARIIKDTLGDSVGQDQETEAIFRDLFRKFNGNVFVFQNNYQGSSSRDSTTKEVEKIWKKMIGKNNESHLIHITEEKSIADLMLGTIAMVSRSRDMGNYLVDMKNRGQTDKRIANVEESLSPLSKALVPFADADLPEPTVFRIG